MDQVFKEPSRLAGRQYMGSNLAERAAIFIKNFWKNWPHAKAQRAKSRQFHRRSATLRPLRPFVY
jgi:hypothetical protein